MDFMELATRRYRFMAVTHDLSCAKTRQAHFCRHDKKHD
jgi:hypothetical protein